MAGRICLTSTGGGGGKTLLSLGLGRAWTKLGRRVQPFKKGPDYIDAAWLSVSCLLPAINLDPFFLSAEELRNLFGNGLIDKDLGLIEGNRGLYDGLDEDGSCSTAQLARILNCPILICIDCTKSSRTIAAILHGLTTFEENLDFCGVILNRVGSQRHETAIRNALKATTDIQVLGALPRMQANMLPERHMGLATHGPHLHDEANKILDKLANFVDAYCDLPKIWSVAQSAPKLNFTPAPVNFTIKQDAPSIGYVLDKALWFYYPENIQELEKAGAKTVRLSLLDRFNDSAWDKISGLYLGGGFPEDFAEEIAASAQLKKIAALANRGIPIYAECGGLIILCKGLEIRETIYPMAQIFEPLIKFMQKPQGLGYVEATVIADNAFYPLGMNLKGHEFHYSLCIWDQHQKHDFALKLSRGRGLAAGYDGLLKNNIWASYLHIFAPSQPIWAKNFVELARKWQLLNN